MQTSNPLLSDWEDMFQIPPFDLIKDHHFDEAFEEAFSQIELAINKISDQSDAPTFQNTVEELERSDELMEKVASIFANLASSNSNPTLEALQRKLAPKWAKVDSDIKLNSKLFFRIDTLFKNRMNLNLSKEQLRVLELYHLSFVRSGAELKGSEQQKLKKILQRLAELGTLFTQNLLKDEREWSMNVTEKDLLGCPQFIKDAASEAAKERGIDGYIITLSRSLIVPFLQFSPRRDLRQKAFSAWELRGANQGKTNNLDIVQETLILRQERANLLGYNSFSDFKLETEMAGSPEKVTELLMAVWEPAKLMANRDAKILTEMMKTDGFDEKFLPSDWRYYSEKKRVAEHDLNETELKPYFQLNQMIKASFHCAKKLFNLDFRRIDAPMYHPDVMAWEVTRENKHIAIFIGDYFARPSKRSGAWCSRFRGQSSMDKDQRPITVNVCNFAKAPEGQQCLLNFDDARTLFHEFGHALHSMLSNVKYAYISGTSVARDFVELPSQLYEHWLSVPSVLEKFAIHAETNEPIPKDLLKKLLDAENYDQGFSTVEYVSSALVDLAFHNEIPTKDPMQKQREVLDRIKMPAEITMRHATPHFAHIFSGDGYSSGYYSYMWSEVMDADAFEAFNEINDPFDSEIAHSLEKHIYSAGGSLPAEELYMNFRGSMPKVEALLKGRGFLKS
ncbi:M3 family metallopeptidase [Amylibacter sp.]|jgi:peptidyl-dipeptidase Dcp|nr:M3 family metallopeptidase [Amylibacter sp.]MDB4007884.1 M3 family metallopeptidase [Amylibacter sp.]MDC0146132.1 M3 family metallopeptidase [Amylibacter sp.]MDC0487957.1 M3 family metallopeptidase [Amylibacter sp.]MDC1267931.1 M3 family metallopeptidase [Amylibacter sp.]